MKDKDDRPTNADFIFSARILIWKEVAYLLDHGSTLFLDEFELFHVDIFHLHRQPEIPNGCRKRYSNVAAICKLFEA